MMYLWNKTRQLGFTLIELVIVLVVVAILAAIAIPKYVDMSATSLSVAKQAMSGAVKSALAIYVSENAGSYPTVTQLASTMPEGTASSTGISVLIDGTTYIVLAYTDTGCTAATAATSNIVKCVGVIP